MEFCQSMRNYDQEHMMRGVRNIAGYLKTSVKLGDTLEDHRLYLVYVSRWTDLAGVHKVFLFFIIHDCLSSYIDNISISRD